MQITIPQNSRASNYPGDYTSDSFDLDASPNKPLKAPSATTNPVYTYNIFETPQYYQIEMAAPALRREDFYVNITEQGHLSIAVRQNELISNESGNKRPTNDDRFNREFLLPDNIDTDFIKSEYRQGVLSFWFLKTVKPCKKHALKIVVY
jgi:HSP20 family protein